MGITKFEILKYDTGLTFNLPIFLDATADEMGVMVGFDGDITPVELFCDFSYTQTGSTIQVYNTIYIEKFKRFYEATFTIGWGDSTTSPLSIHSGTTLSTVSHIYSGTGEYNISITLDSPWTKQKLSKSVTIPQEITVLNPLGTLTGITIPYTILTGETQDYLNDLDYGTGYSGNTTFNYVSIGGSRIVEKKLYGGNIYTGVTTGTTSGLIYSAYTIDDLSYRDFSDGYTMITGTTSGFTKEEIFNIMLTRDEHFLGFVDEPTIYSDVFVERGKTGVMENNLRLGEIDNMMELDKYGNGFFNVRKQ